jgi:predicted phage terminase large subunit-like protein
MPIYHVDNHVAKMVRIRQLTSHLARGRLKFKKNSRGAKLLVQQLRDFPNGDHDDGPDALELAIRVLRALLEARSSEPDYTLERAYT